MDEITVDMDVLGRADLLAFFEEECAERGATIIYATHIFDGLEAWVTHVAYLEGGELLRCGPRRAAPPAAAAGRGGGEGEKRAAARCLVLPAASTAAERIPPAPHAAAAGRRCRS